MSEPNGALTKLAKVFWALAKSVLQTTLGKDGLASYVVTCRDSLLGVRLRTRTTPEAGLEPAPVPSALGLSYRLI